ncbi:MAG TPA: TonB-dependent receptor [Candidatus Omnitrophota bacterium]|nr:TonB-dependent receptor [Candidatus Omnitrophota bacterium]
MPEHHLRRRLLASAGAFLAAATCAQAEEPKHLDEISVTATRAERATKDVPQSITVVGSERIESEKMMNIKDALQGTPGVQIDSKNGGYDVRLVVRGAGVNTAYGVREIMVLRDGVPMTDPDSFTLFDRIDTQDIERIEVLKGPGNMFGSGSAGGTIHIMSKSVFADEANRVRVGLGNLGAESYHARVGGMVSDNQAVALTASRRVMDNDWRRWNNFETNQLSAKHGIMGADGGVLESEIAWGNAFTQLPGAMDLNQFNEFRRTGKQTDTYDAWKRSGRDSETVFMNSRYEKDYGDWTFKPRVYATHWQHYHPVTGAIGVIPDNYTFGTDIEGQVPHRLGGMAAALDAGVTYRGDLNDSEKYKYKYFTTGGGGRITRVLSDVKGDLIETSQTDTHLYGVFAHENVQLSPNLSLDAGARLDRVFFDIETNEMQKYDYATAKYAAGGGFSHVTPTFTLFSPKLGLSYKLSNEVTAYGSVARGEQIPSSTQLESNSGLTPSVSLNYEIGLKQRSDQWSFDTALYYNPVTDDIVTVYDNAETSYQNAGKTIRQGWEINGSHTPLPGLTFGGGYAYQDYTYDRFFEVVNRQTVNRSGKRVPWTPMHQYSLFAEYRHEVGLKARVTTLTNDGWQMDNANTKDYGGSFFITNIMVGWDFDKHHSVALNVDNLFNEHYAIEAKKDAGTGRETFTGAPPRSVLATYMVKF